MNDGATPLDPHALLAVADFLRGVERRAAVFAELQSGSTAHGDRALASAMRAFRRAVAQRPLPDWDLLFWQLLLGTPQLRRPPRGGRWAPPVQALAGLGNGLRAVLLLELLSGLGGPRSAAALGLSIDLHAEALRRVLSRKPDLDLSKIRQRPQALAPARLVGLAKRRERLLRHGDVLGGQAAPTWRRAAPALAVAGCAIALGAWVLFRGTGNEPLATPRALPPASRPLATFDPDFALLTHRDFEQLAAPGDRAFLDHLDFYAWVAAQTASATDIADGAGTVAAADPTQDAKGGARHGAQ